MTEQQTETDQQHAVENVSIGETLRKAREAASYSVTYVSAHTHLKEDIIEALENDDHEKLPSPVFVKGYLRSYAKLLEIDVEPLLGDYQQPAPVEYVTPQVKKPRKVKSSGADPVVIWSSVTVIALLLGLVTTWWVHRDDTNPVELASVVEQFDNVENSSLNDVSSAPSSSPQEAHQVGLGTVDPKNISLEQNEVLSNDEDKVNQTADSQQEVIVQTRNIIESPVSGGNIDKVRITVRYTQESWTEIFDARKRRLLHGLIKPGATRVISGQAPFNVFLGNSPGVELEINGKPFDHSIYMRRNNTARFLIEDINS